MDQLLHFAATFARPGVAAIYLVGNLALGIHLFHGTWSLFQSLGLNNPRWNRWRRGFAVGVAVLITGMNVMFPISVMTGIVDPDDDPDCRTNGDVIISCEGQPAEDSEAAT